MVTLYYEKEMAEMGCCLYGLPADNFFDHNDFIRLSKNIKQTV